MFNPTFVHHIVFRHFLHCGLVCAGLVSISHNVQAQSDANPPPTESAWQLSLGGIVMADGKAWRGYDTQVLAVPYIDIRYGNWFLSAEQGLGYGVSWHDEVSVYVAVGYRDDSYDQNLPFLTTLEEHEVFKGYEAPRGETTFNLGISGYFMSLDLAQDMSDQSKGLTATFALSLPVLRYRDTVNLDFSISATWLEMSYVNSVYGVSAAQQNVLVGRNAYAVTEDAVNYQVGLSMLVLIDQHWSLISRISAERLDDNIALSPLLDDSSNAMFAVGIGYTW
jgi:outer membrane scaffolding protein for murein synthesis (MipA/OmpV family)